MECLFAHALILMKTWKLMDKHSAREENYANLFEKIDEISEEGALCKLAKF